MAGRRPEITGERVLGQLWDIATMEDAKPAERLKALELVGRHLGMFQGGAEEAGKGVQPVLIYGMPEGGDD